MPELPADLPDRLRRAKALRADLFSQGTNLYRAVHLSETSGLFSLERAAEVGVLSVYAELSAEAEQELAEICAGVLDLPSIYLKRRPPQASHAANVAREGLSPPEPLIGPARPELTAFEAGIPYLIRPGTDLSIGLFSDARPARQWLRDHAAGRRVLNTFAYTCGFGLAACLGGAAQVKNLDASRKVLAWGRQNYGLSHLAAPDTDFIYGDVFDWLSRFARRGQRFSALVLDPPSFARAQKGTFRAERDYPALVEQAAQVLEPGGLLLALQNHAGLDAATFETQVQRGLREAGRGAELLARFGAGQDYPQATHLKVLAVQLD